MSSAPDFATTVGRLGDAVVVAVIGEIDMATAPRMWATAIAAMDVGGDRLVLDLTATTFADSTALHVMCRLNERYGPHAFTIRGPNADLMRVITITGLDQFFTITPASA